jgi:biopolymer transport protein TolR
MAMSAGGSAGGGMRRGRRRSHRAGAISEINITPMVDVMLVLLIIFMVAAPMMISGVPINAPDTPAPPVPTQSDEEPLSVTIKADGTLYIMETEVTADRLIENLTAVAAERASDQIFLRADGSLSYEQVMVIMGALSAAGFAKITLVTESGGPGLDGSDGQ